LFKTNTYSLDEEFSFNKSQIKNFNFFWLGFIIYTVSYTFSGITFINGKIFQLLQIIGLMLMISGAVKIIRFKIENKYLLFVYFIYCCWLCLIILKGAGSLSDKTYLVNFFLDPAYGGIIYFVPLMLLFPTRLLFYKKVFDAIFILGLFYFLYDIIFIRVLLSADRESILSQGAIETSGILSLPCGFLLLTYSYQPNKKKLLAIGAILLTLLFAVIRARRTLIFMTSTIVLFAAIQYLLTSKRKFLFIYFSILLFCIGAIYASQMYKVRQNPIFGFVAERGNEDTRTAVELYFYADMKTNDWIFGRGINGEYFCPIVEQEVVTNYRGVIETGYLEIILKGGLVSLGLLLLITIPAIINGVFFSKNSLSKAAGIWIFLVLISLYPTTIDSFILRYILVWISVAICYSKKIRNMPDDFIKKYFLSP
jgi:hypothetical protein